MLIGFGGGWLFWVWVGGGLVEREKWRDRKLKSEER